MDYFETDRFIVIAADGSTMTRKDLSQKRKRALSMKKSLALKKAALLIITMILCLAMTGCNVFLSKSRDSLIKWFILAAARTPSGQTCR